MYPFYVNNEKVFSFSYKPSINDIVRDDKTMKWYKIEEVAKGRGRKVYGRTTIPLDIR